MNVPFLGRVPLAADIVASGDNGRPFAAQRAASPQATAFAEIVQAVLAGMTPRVSTNPTQQPDPRPIMKIAIPLAGGRLSDHFGHCEQFALIEADPATKTILSQTLATPPPHEPGVLPRWLHQQGAQVIIAGGMGQRALQLFAQNNITVKSGPPGQTPEQLVAAFCNGSLRAGPSPCTQHAHGCH
jgi:predicted Fe-Mo cluster-binding NifX family protein